jgi:hypothetical protein
VAESCGALAPYLPVRIVFFPENFIFSFLIIENSLSHYILIRKAMIQKMKGSHQHYIAL